MLAKEDLSKRSGSQEKRSREDDALFKKAQTAL
jgi:hypothetical protein